jgi:hypothetical protein
MVAIKLFLLLLIERGLSPPLALMKLMIWWPLNQYDYNGEGNHLVATRLLCIQGLNDKVINWWNQINPPEM